LILEEIMLYAKNISKFYQGAENPAVRDVTLTVRQGDFLSITGRSGSGKSTLLHVLSSLIRPDSGSLLLEGKDIACATDRERTRLRKEKFAVVFQQHHLLPYLSALENVLLPFLDTVKPVGERELASARRMLEQVRLAGREGSRPGQLSGGEQQRVAIARALAGGARVLFADEPTGNLDSATGEAIIALLQKLNHEGLTVVMVTHNPEFARCGNRAVTMADGRLA
jgi:putative ABC transport system ATP-binding protein